MHDRDDETLIAEIRRILPSGQVNSLSPRRASQADDSLHGEGGLPRLG
jgi:hypothetical protein